MFIITGTSKACSKKSGNGTKKKLHELDNGLVPFPIKTCFYCNKYFFHELQKFKSRYKHFFLFYRSCRKAPMVACDFCPLVFHLDCLDPPLVCMPVGKWMCPTHPQNIVRFFPLRLFIWITLSFFKHLFCRNPNCYLILD